MSARDFQASLGFELVTEFQPNGSEVHLIREGASEREATLTERVLWGQLLSTLEALRDARAFIAADRADMADAHMCPLTNALDEDGAAVVAEYDAALLMIDAALINATGSAA